MSWKSRGLSLLAPLLVAVASLSLLLGGAGLVAGEGAVSSEPAKAIVANYLASPLTTTLPPTGTLHLPLIAKLGDFLPPPIPPPLPPPVPVVMTEPFDVASVRAALDAEDKDLRLARIGFHVGPDDGPTDPVLLQWMSALDAAGIPFVLKSVDNAEPVLEALQMRDESGVPHVLIYRRSGNAYDTPNYLLPAEEAAVLHWERHRDNFPLELRPYKDRLWLETINEVDKNRADWLGTFALKTAELALADGFNWAAFGWSTGEPEPYHWRTPGMLAFLRLAAQYPHRLAIALHEYSLAPTDVAWNYPWHVGRFQFLFEVVDTARIPRPTVLITEWGWTHAVLPPPEVALPQIAWANWLYSAYPEVQGAAIWYLGLNTEFGDIAGLTRLLIEPVRDYTMHNYFIAARGWGRIDMTLFLPADW